jgi:hypothetical protein
MVLPRSGLAAGIRVFPAESVPVIDMEGQRQHIGTVRELGEQLIGRRTGRAALRGEKLDHDRTLTGLRRADGDRQTDRKEKSAGFYHCVRLHQTRRRSRSIERERSDLL